GRGAALAIAPLATSGRAVAGAPASGREGLAAGAAGAPRSYPGAILAAPAVIRRPATADAAVGVSRHVAWAISGDGLLVDGAPAALTGASTVPVVRVRVGWWRRAGAADRHQEVAGIRVRSLLVLDHHLEPEAHAPDRIARRDGAAADPAQAG